MIKKGNNLRHCGHRKFKIIKDEIVFDQLFDSSKQTGVLKNVYVINWSAVSMPPFSLMASFFHTQE